MTYRVILRTGQHFGIECDDYHVSDSIIELTKEDGQGKNIIVGTLITHGIAAILSDGVAVDAKPTED